MGWLDYRFGPKERSGDQGRAGQPMFSVRQVFLLPLLILFCMSIVVALPLLIGRRPVRRWQVPFVMVSAAIGATARAIGDMINGLRPRWDFEYQCWLMGLRLER